jgi:hypothetical protein
VNGQLLVAEAREGVLEFIMTSAGSLTAAKVFQSGPSWLYDGRFYRDSHQLNLKVSQVDGEEQVVIFTYFSLPIMPSNNNLADPG